MEENKKKNTLSEEQLKDVAAGEKNVRHRPDYVDSRTIYIGKNIPPESPIPPSGVIII